MTLKAKRAVIIGGGQSGARAAQAMRDAGFAGSIQILSAESHYAYERPKLSKELLQDVDIPVPFVFGENEYEELSIEFLAGCVASEIDRQAQKIRTEDGRSFAYDCLLIATGSRVREISIDGYPREHCLTLRTLDDCRAIGNLLERQPTVVVIGGGFIGLECAATMRQRGCNVTVVEAGPLLLPRIGCLEASEMVLAHHRAMGTEVRLGTQATRGKAGSIELSDGMTVAADLVVAGVGVIPETALAEQAGLAINDGIVTDQYGRTSDPNIFAAGDVTNHYNPLYDRHIRLESWENANLQAAAAGYAMAGELRPYAEIPWLWSDQGTLNLQIAGVPEHVDRTVVRGDPHGTEGIAVFQFSGDELVAGLTVNRAKEMPIIRRMLRSGELGGPPDKLTDETIPLRKFRNIAID